MCGMPTPQPRGIANAEEIAAYLVEQGALPPNHDAPTRRRLLVGAHLNKIMLGLVVALLEDSPPDDREMGAAMFDHGMRQPAGSS